MQISPISAQNNNTSFEASLKLKGDVPYFALENLPYLEDLANRIGKSTDTICLFCF